MTKRSGQVTGPANSVSQLAVPQASLPTIRLADGSTVVRPRHVAIIMDGNGRWAEQRGEPRLAGHREGAATVRAMTTYARELGIGYLTLYSFSSENWGRPVDEVDGLMDLLRTYLSDELPTMQKNGIRLQSIGDTARLPLLVRTALASVQLATQKNTGMELTLALSYGARDELVMAAKALAIEVKAGKLKVDDIDAAALSQRLYTRHMPDPDLLIRTSGEMRLSNFLLWQIAYAELVVTKTAWPEFSRTDFDDALRDFSSRQRRYGLTANQIGGSSS
jgi:undecaprenyl diphosphate synthase